MYKQAYISTKHHATLSALKEAGQIKSIMSFIGGAIDTALQELQAPDVPTDVSTDKRIVININIGSDNNVR